MNRHIKISYILIWDRFNLPLIFTRFNSVTNSEYFAVLFLHIYYLVQMKVRLTQAHRFVDSVADLITYACVGKLISMTRPNQCACMKKCTTIGALWDVFGFWSYPNFNYFYLSGINISNRCNLPISLECRKKIRVHALRCGKEKYFFTRLDSQSSV